MAVPMEDVIACLGFTPTACPVARVANFPQIAQAMSILANNRTPDSITSEQRDAAEKLMDIMVSEKPDDLEAAEVAAQVLAMSAADDQRSPHLMRVDKWVLSCTRILRRCQPGCSLPKTESLLICAASCLADLLNNPRSTIVCSTRATEIYKALQYPFSLPRVSNRMLYFQLCRALSEVLHPSTWPMHEPAVIPAKMLDCIAHLLLPPPLASPSANGLVEVTVGNIPLVNGMANGVVASGLVGSGTQDMEREGEVDEEGEGEEEELEVVNPESLIHMQACKVILVMSTSGAADLIVKTVPSIVRSLTDLRQNQVAEPEEILQADAALMSLWLSPKAFEATPIQLRPIIAKHLLKTLGSEEFEDNHQDCSLALVTALINPVASVKVQTISLFADAVRDDPSLADIVIGHIEDTQSLAHQSVVFFLLFLADTQEWSVAVTRDAETTVRLLRVLISAALTGRHYAPIAVINRLLAKPTSRQIILDHFTDQMLNRLQTIPANRALKEADTLAATIAASKGLPSPEPIARSNSLPDIVDDDDISSVESEESGKDEGERVLRTIARQSSKLSRKKSDLRRGRSSGNLAELAARVVEIEALEDRLKSASVKA